jgi:hypothetical protein
MTTGRINQVTTFGVDLVGWLVGWFGGGSTSYHIQPRRPEKKDEPPRKQKKSAPHRANARKQRPFGDIKHLHREPPVWRPLFSLFGGLLPFIFVIPRGRPPLFVEAAPSVPSLAPARPTYGRSGRESSGFSFCATFDSLRYPWRAQRDFSFSHGAPKRA